MSNKIHFRQGIKNLPEICKQHGVKKVVIAPGSRNVPLILAFTADSDLECLSITDERSAAYIALGIAQQSKKAVALVCTSGTAALNFAPAIAEAYYQNLPLLVFTADRPNELIDQADGQTIRQSKMYANYIKSSIDLPIETTKVEVLEHSDRAISQTIDTALAYPQGPVHINVPLREPIYAELPKKHSSPKIISTAKAEQELTKESIAVFKKEWKKHKKKLVLFGIHGKDETLNKIANQLAEEPDTVVIAENLSNISGEKIISTPENFFASLDTELKPIFTPDLLITVGHSIICKQLKLFLKEYKAGTQWQLASSLPYVDSYQSLQTTIPVDAVSFFNSMPLGTKKGEYASICLKHNKNINYHSSAYMEKLPHSDWLTIRKFLNTVPADADIHLANSTPVRIAQLFPSKTANAYYCNRGTSGIDGSLSTAVGAAIETGKSTFFICGDLSFVYDSNGLWNKYLPDNLKIIVLNNNGGNIFRLIGDKELTKDCEEFLTTPHQINIKALTTAYGVNYLQGITEAQLNISLRDLYKSTTCTVLEVMTSAEVNTKLYESYFIKLKQHIT